MGLPQKKEFIERLDTQVKQMSGKHKPSYAAFLSECVRIYNNEASKPKPAPVRVAAKAASPVVRSKAGAKVETKAVFKFCESCGYRMEETARFCAKCGLQPRADLANADPAYPSYTYYDMETHSPHDFPRETKAGKEILSNGIADIVVGAVSVVGGLVVLNQLRGITFWLFAPNVMRSGAMAWWLIVLGVLTIVAGITCIKYRLEPKKAALIGVEYAVLLVAYVIFILHAGIPFAQWAGGWAWVGVLSPLGIPGYGLYLSYKFMNS
jgi:hypothetical protein